jgi:hypothetical protein
VTGSVKPLGETRLARKKRKKRSKGDLESELRDQLKLLINACDSYDKGFKAIGKHIALSLRVLLHHHGQSQALLQQLGLRNIRFMDTAGKINRNNLLTDCNLCAMKVGSEGAEYQPKHAVGGGATPPQWIRFADWWNMPVVKDQQERKFNRRELILHVADTDGGAHVDSELDEAYMALSRENSLGWVFTNGNVEIAFEGPELPCIRQIAYETIETLRKKAFQYF